MQGIDGAEQHKRPLERTCVSLQSRCGKSMERSLFHGSTSRVIYWKYARNWKIYAS